jgi:hypothetical protein
VHRGRDGLGYDWHVPRHLQPKHGDYEEKKWPNPQTKMATAKASSRSKSVLAALAKTACRSVSVLDHLFKGLRDEIRNYPCPADVPTWPVNLSTDACKKVRDLSPG